VLPADSYVAPSALELAAQLPERYDDGQGSRESDRVALEAPADEYEAVEPVRLVVGRSAGGAGTDSDDSDHDSFLERQEYVDPAAKVGLARGRRAALEDDGAASVGTGGSGDSGRAGEESSDDGSLAGDLRHFAALADDEAAMAGDYDHHASAPLADDERSLAEGEQEAFAGDYVGLKEDEYPSDDSSSTGGGERR